MSATYRLRRCLVAFGGELYLTEKTIFFANEKKAKTCPDNNTFLPAGERAIDETAVSQDYPWEVTEEGGGRGGGLLGLLAVPAWRQQEQSRGHIYVDGMGNNQNSDSVTFRLCQRIGCEINSTYGVSRNHEKEEQTGRRSYRRRTCN